MPQLEKSRHSHEDPAQPKINLKMKLFLKKRKRKHLWCDNKELGLPFKQICDTLTEFRLLPGAFQANTKSRSWKGFIQAPPSPLALIQHFLLCSSQSSPSGGQRNTAWSDGLHPGAQPRHPRTGVGCGVWEVPWSGLSCWRDLEGHWELGS